MIRCHDVTGALVIHNEVCDHVRIHSLGTVLKYGVAVTE